MAQQIKLRWNINVNSGNSTKSFDAKRVQLPIKKSQITGAELNALVSRYMQQKYPTHESIAKIEIKEDLTDGCVTLFGVQPYYWDEKSAASVNALESAFAKWTLNLSEQPSTEEEVQQNQRQQQQQSKLKRKRVLQDPKRRLRVVTDDEIIAVPSDQQCLILKLHVTYFGPTNHMNTPASYYKPATATTGQSSSNSTEQEERPQQLIRPLIVDAGVNLFDSDFAKDLKPVVHKGFAAGVHKMVLISTDEKNSTHSLTLARTRKGSLFPTVGVHPNLATVWGDEASKIRYERLKRLVEECNDEIIAIGECGLDYKRCENEEQREAQIHWLEAQIALAGNLHKPIMLHERDAFEPFVRVVTKPQNLEILQRERAIINCFTGTEQELETYVNLGFYIGITGFICNEERAKHMRDIVRRIPLDRLVISSDAPYLTPFNMPRPFPRRNEPAFLPHVLVQVAEYTERSIEDIAKITNENIARLFGV